MDRYTYIKRFIIVQLMKNEKATEEEKQKQIERSKKYGIGIKKTGHITKPSEFASIDDELFGDPVNYKYPIDKEHVLVAIRYFNREGMRLAGGYTPEEWEIIGKRIANQTDGKYVYKNGKIVKRGEE